MSSKNAPEGYPGAPPWVKILGAVVAGLIILVVVLKLLGIGDHGPGRHFGETGSAEANVENH